MFKLHRPSTSLSVVYSSSLFCLDLGHALWFPEPHKTGEPQIGDVGYVLDGALIRLFNINASKTDYKVTFWPKAFETTEPLADSKDVFILDERRGVIRDGHHLSRGVQERDTHGSISVAASTDVAVELSAGYTCKETQGALLVLRSQGHSETMFWNDKLKTYMLRQHEAWCEYLHNDLGQTDVSPEDIVLVSGWVKTSPDWAAAVFSEFVSKHYASIKGHASRFIGLELSHSQSRAQSGVRKDRQGAKYQRDNGAKRAEMEQDQSIFLKRYKLKRRLVILKIIAAGAGYDRLPDHGRGGDAAKGLLASERLSDADDEDSEEDGLQWLVNKVVDPLDILLDYILEVSDAEVAIARDDDIQAILGAEDWPIDLATYLRRVRPPVDVEDQCGTISIPELLAHERVQRLERRFVTAADLLRWSQISYDGAGMPSMAPVKFTDNPADDSSPNVPAKWPYIEFPDLSTSSDTFTISPFTTSRDGKLLAAVEGTLGIIVWRLSDGLVVQRLGGQGHTAPICAIAFSPDSRTLVSGSADETAIVWSIRTGQAIFRLEGHRAAVDSVTYNSDGSLVVTASGTGSTLKFWDASSGMPLGTFHHSWWIAGFLLSQKGSKLAVQLEEGVALYQAGSGGPIVQLGVVTTPHSRKVAAVAFSPDGDRLFMSDNWTDARVYDTDSCETLVEFNPAYVYGTVLSAAFTPDSTKLATISGARVIPIWSFKKGGGQPQSLIHMGLSGTAVAFSPSGAFLAAAGDASGGAAIRVWDWKSRKLVVEFTAPASEIGVIKFLPDSRSLLTFAKAGSVCLWNVADALRLR